MFANFALPIALLFFLSGLFCASNSSLKLECKSIDDEVESKSNVELNGWKEIERQKSIYSIAQNITSSFGDDGICI